ncbi:hypothetical protein LCGC14_0275710 [marine sediment metagenome]|uniref:Uncharacterized protein n=1 Tax=marine sediment metagenome TaxID=412755 RepID=A0A0F9TXN8_9ZZZZ
MIGQTVLDSHRNSDQAHRYLPERLAREILHLMVRHVEIPAEGVKLVAVCPGVRLVAAAIVPEPSEVPEDSNILVVVKDVSVDMTILRIADGFVYDHFFGAKCLRLFEVGLGYCPEKTTVYWWWRRE